MKKHRGFPDLFGSESVRPEILALHILSHIKDDTIKRMLQLPVTETGREANQGYDSVGSPTLLDVILQNSIVDAKNEFILGCGFCYARKDSMMGLFPPKDKTDLAKWRVEINDRVEIFSKDVNYFLEVRAFDTYPTITPNHIEMTYYYHFNKKFPW